MNGRLGGTLGVWVVVGAALAAAEFWETKHFTTWSDKEVEKILTDSPWSREVGVPLDRLARRRRRFRTVPRRRCWRWRWRPRWPYQLKDPGLRARSVAAPETARRDCLVA